MTTAVAHELVELSHDLARAVSEHDVDALERMLAEEFTLQGAAGQLDREEFLAPEIYGNTAVLVSRYSQVAQLEGRDLSHRMNVTDIWTRRDSRWQIVRRHATLCDA